MPDDQGDISRNIARVILNRGRHIDLYEYILRHPEELIKGVLVAGSIGSGKTQKAMKILLAALESEYGGIVFDNSRDYEKLLAVRSNIVVIDYREFIQNPLEPPTGMRLDEWFPTFIQVFAQNYGLKDPSIAILQKAANNLILDAPSSQDKPPMLDELLDEVREYRPRQRSSEVGSHVSVQNRLESLLDSEVGRCVKAIRGFQPTDFEEGLLVVQLPATGITRAHELLVGITVAKLFAYRAWQRTHNIPPTNNVLVVLEEAHKFLSENRRADRRGERSHLERALIEGRKLGIGFMVVDQMPHQISSHVLGSSNMWVVRRLIDPQAKRVVGEALCLDHVWSREGLISLPTGGAFVRVEKMTELEAVSPLAHRLPIHGMEPWDSIRLPALVAVPEPDEAMIQCNSEFSARNLMANNERYLEFFERNAREYMERLNDTVPQYVLDTLNSFLKRTISPQFFDDCAISEYTGISPDMAQTIRNRYDGRRNDKRKASVSSSIYEIKARCKALSSKGSLEVLSCLESKSGMNTQKLCEATSLGSSWLSRILGELGSRGYVKRVGKPQRGAAVYRLTEYGKEALSWGRFVVSIIQGDARHSEGRKIVEIHHNDLEWLLDLCSENLEIRQNSYSAGWRGDNDLRETMMNLLFKIEALMSFKRTEAPSVGLRMNLKLFKSILLTLENDVLGTILQSRNPVTIRSLGSKTGLSDRSIRRQLRTLEKMGIICRSQTSGLWNVEMSNSWKMLLINCCDLDRNTVRLTFESANQLVRHALDNAALEMFTENLTDFNTLDYFLSRCLSIEETMID
ncbi:MAG: hypothetical protein ACFFFC_13830 [Candidatus Thorarchaeota archaeon]